MKEKVAPDFTLNDQYGKPFNLYSELDKKIMLVFYPKDKTYVCTKQLCEYNDNLATYRDKGYKIIGISIDSEKSHRKFSDKYDFEFKILSDFDKEVSKMYDALSLNGMSKRKIVLIDLNKEIIYENSVFPLFYQKTSSIMKNITK